ncbi:MAG: ABC transporter permease [Coriobacteriales bacterium]|jgi:putative ABC transport system permease protein|nr:ABC transporter permease [Coriobacteriales bacterium]
MLAQSVRTALAAIGANKMRAFLTMLGIIIGVTALVVLVSLVSSATRAVTDEISSLGNDLLSVTIRDDKGKPLKSADLAQIAQDSTSISLIAPVSTSSATAKQGTSTYSLTLTGTTNAYFWIMGSELAEGRFLLDADLKNNTSVLVLSYETADEIYGRTDVVGLELALDGVKYLIIGVLAEEEGLMTSMGDNYTAYVPYTVLERATSAASGGGASGMSGAGGGASSGASGITSFYAAAKEADNIDLAEAELTASLLGLLKGDEDAFSIRNNNSLSETMASVTDTFALLLGAIAGISLLVGGIGIMNIMLVSVTERTREIGIRKAVGAKRLAITLQFLIEALVICLIGCALGIVFSGIILGVVNLTVGADSSTTYSFSPEVVIVAVGFSTFIGVAFGLYPANKAARMHPIDALRFE